MPFHNIISATSSGGSGDTFDTIQTDAGTSPVASGASTLTLTSSDASVTITGNAGTDTVDFVVVSGSGDVSGPASSTDNAIVRFDGLTGKLIQNSVGTLSDAGLLSTADVTITNMTPASVLFAGTGGAVSQDNTNFTWDNTNKSLITGDPGSEGTGINLNGTTYNSKLKVSDIGGTTPAQFIIHRHSTTLPAAIISSRSKSDTSSHSSVAAGDELFVIGASGWTGSHYDTFGIINFSADASGTVSSTSSPGRIDFRVPPDSSDSPAIALSIRQTKVIEMPAYGTGIAHFSASGVISSSLIVNADVSASAAIEITKIANGTANQLIKANAGATANEFATLSGGTGLSVTFGAGTIALANTGVTSIVAGTAIGVSGATGAVTVNNTGVTSIVAGTGISISGGTGAVTVNSTITQYTDELAQDAVGTILTDSSTIDFTYNDGANTITAAMIANSSTQKVEITKNSGAVVGTRKQLNFIEGSNVTLTVADDAGNDQVDITIAATGASGAPSTATYVTLSTDATLTNERVLTGTLSQITVTDNGAGSTVVLSTPQNIATGSSPTFTGLTLSGLSTGAVINTAGVLSSVAPGTSGNVLTSNGTTWTSAAPAGASIAIGSSITSGTATRVLFEGAGPVLADDADFTFDTATNRLAVPAITGGSSSGGDLTLTATTHATKGYIILDGTVDIYPSLTSATNLDVVHFMPTLTHTAGTINWFRISPTETMSGAAVISRLIFVDGTWTQSGTSFGVFNMFYSAATFTTSDGNAPPAPLVFYNQTAYTIQHNVGTTTYTPTAFVDQQSFNATTASANVTLNSSMISFTSTPVISVSNASATLACTNRIALNIADVAYTATGSLTLTNNYGIKIANMVVGTSGNRTVTNVYGIYSELTSNSNRYFINSDGDAQSFHKGNFRIGKASSATSELQFANASNSNIVSIKASTSTSGSYTLTLPVDDGTANQVLKTDGSGVLSWTTPSGSSPLTTKGDIYTYTSADARLAVGTNDYFLVADSAESTGIRWNGRVKAKTTSDSAGKTSDATITSADTVAALACTLVTGKKYAIRGLLMFSSTSATPDAKMQFRDDGSIVVNEIHAILSYTDTGITTTASNQNAGVTGVNTDSTALQVAATGRAIVSITGYVDVTTGGTLDIAWAQNTSNATAVVLETGSWIMYEEI